MATVIAFHVYHDANVCVCVGGELIVVLELERLFEERYYCSPIKREVFLKHWTEAIRKVQKFSNLNEFDYAVTSWVLPKPLALLKTLVKADRWVTASHHDCHASIGFYDSPFNNALIMSYDGGGNDGTFNVYHGHRGDVIKHVERVHLNLGGKYRCLPSAMPEITKNEFNPDVMQRYTGFPPLAFAGKLMGYSALGNVRSEWIPAFREFYELHICQLGLLFQLGHKIGLSLEQNALDEESARDVAATNQYVFTLIICEQVDRCIKRYNDEDNPRLDGIILTGGCALNVNANQVIVSKFGYPVHVPSAPNDCGISVGAAWCVIPQNTENNTNTVGKMAGSQMRYKNWPSRPQRIQFCGLPLFDANMLNHFSKLREARQVTVSDIAQLLTNGAVVGLVRGRQEFGPRALGHRSVLAYPNKSITRERINTLKGREWYRPLCPSVSVEFAPRLVMGDCTKFIRVFHEKNSASTEDPKVDPLADWTTSSHLRLKNDDSDNEWTSSSPYMSFAPLLTDEAQKKYPAITHYDGTARYQTVSKEDDPWYHSLLVEVGKRTNGSEILLNTSFNVKGKPILNRISNALRILDSAKPGFLDYVVIEDRLFASKPQET